MQYLTNTRLRPFSVMLAGDFNYSDWDWETNNAAIHQEFRDILDDLGVTQHVTEPTRLQNTPNLIATNMPD